MQCYLCCGITCSSKVRKLLGQQADWLVSWFWTLLFWLFCGHCRIIQQTPNIIPQSKYILKQNVSAFFMTGCPTTRCKQSSEMCYYLIYLHIIVPVSTSSKTVLSFSFTWFGQEVVIQFVWLISISRYRQHVYKQFRIITPCMKRHENEIIDISQLWMIHSSLFNFLFS